jgi:Fe-S oxidoreductase
MLTITEKIAFIVLIVISSFLTWKTFSRMIAVIGKGQGKLHFDNLGSRIWIGFKVLFLQHTVLKDRLLLSIVHTSIAWAFILYFLVNVGDVLYGFIPNFHFLGTGMVGNIYRLFVDIFSVMAVLGVLVFLMRRFVFSSEKLKYTENIKLMESAAPGIQRDSLIVGLFIIGHVGFRFVSESFSLAIMPDSWQPLASGFAILWSGWDANTITLFHHITWWLALGLILAFIPYFPKSKHIHLMMGPFNYFSRPNRNAPGTLDKIDFEAEDVEEFGVSKLTDLDKTGIVDAYACIMCNRCQDVCPAYVTGKELSPSALEVNKRYYLNENQNAILNDNDSLQPILEWGMSESALWACTSCAACVEICPVGNEPMFDILNIRRSQVLMESKFPEQLQTAYDGMEINGNPWNINKDRLEWVQQDEELQVKTVEQNPDFDILYWVGCAGAFDQKGGDIARAFTKILNKANVNFAVLGNKETCTGDSARRSGNEYLFSMLAESNVENLNAANVKKIVTTCPHCLHTLKNEYPQFGGNYEVIHHSQFISDLQSDGKLNIKSENTKVTFHDPCYLGRHNKIYDEPRNVLSNANNDVVEMDRNKSNSFCCGAGGARMFMEETVGKRINVERTEEALATGCNVVGTACPFCMTMLTDGVKDKNKQDEVAVKDIAEIVSEKIQ